LVTEKPEMLSRSMNLYENQMHGKEKNKPAQQQHGEKPKEAE